MITKIIMIFMMRSVTTVRKNHENHGNLGQKKHEFRDYKRVLKKTLNYVDLFRSIDERSLSIVPLSIVT